MPNVIFMRHAKTTLNKEGKFAGRADCDTTKEGLEEAKKNFHYNSNDFDYIYCSPLKRTIQTLDAVLPEHQEPIIDDRIIERYVGQWENMPYSAVSDALIESYVKGYYDPPESETYETVKRRVCKFVEDLFSSYSKEDRILVVSHAGVLRQVRDNFLPDMDKSAIKNSGTITVTDEDYEIYLKDKEERER